MESDVASGFPWVTGLEVTFRLSMGAAAVRQDVFAAIVITMTENRILGDMV